MSATITAAPGPQAARHVVGIGEFAVSAVGQGQIVTHALGSCIAVCIWDPLVRVGGLLHFLLPDSTLNPEQACRTPATFADTGLPRLFHAAYDLGLVKSRCRVSLIGGAEVAGLSGSGSLNVGKRNALAARRMLWANGLLIHADVTGGHAPRSVTLDLGHGRVTVMSGRQITHTL